MDIKYIIQCCWLQCCQQQIYLKNKRDKRSHKFPTIFFKGNQNIPLILSEHGKLYFF